VTKEVGQVGVPSKGAWDVASDASNYELYNEAPATSLTLEGWDISTASYSQKFNVVAQDTTPGNVFFKPDGTKMYVLGNAGDDVNEYNLSTAWNISSATYLQSFSVAAQDTVPKGIFFKPDGTKMYVVGDTGDAVYEYNLSTAWDISTASYNQNFSVSAQDTSPSGIFFKPDGFKMYVVGYAGDAVYEYNLSADWNISSASYSQSFSVSAQETVPTGIYFKDDGLKMYVVGQGGDAVYEYNLSEDWNISSASYSQNVDVSAQDTVPYDVFFKPDGTKMYIVGSAGDAVYEYSLAKANLGTGSFSSSDLGKRIFVDDGGEAILTSANGYLKLVSDFGASSYTSGNWSLSGLDVDATNGITLSEFNTAWDVSQASYLQSLSLIQTVPYGIFFKPDGTRLYIIGGTSDDIDQYDLTTAWDISTASTNGRFVVLQDTNPKDLFFKPDGLKMYVIGSTQDDVFEYSLSTAWDVTSASYFQNLPITETSPEGLFFKPDGTKMYTIGLAGSDGIDEYNLSTAWDITTASLLQAFTIGNAPSGIFFRQDGLKAFITQQTGGNDRVSEYNLTTAWDVSTLVFAQSFDVSDEDDSAQGVFFHPLGNKMYIVGNSNDSVYEYDVGTILQPIAQYLPSVTNVGGQIDSTYWTDINSMNADDTDNDGEVYYAVSTDDRTTWSIAKDSDGVRNIVRNNGGTWEYNSAVGPRDGWDLSEVSYLQNLDVSSQELYPSDVFFKPDGLKMYVSGTDGDDINEYNLSTAWDVTSASYSQSFSLTSQETGLAGFYFKPDGTKLYGTGYIGDGVYEYSLSTSWDVSTASYTATFSVSSQEATPYGVSFKTDGLKMYIVGVSGDDINEYNLSTAWDVTSASYSQNFSLSSQDTAPSGIFFKPDGTELYVSGLTGDSVYQYDLSTAWDVSSLSFSQSFSVASQETSPQGLFLNADGDKLYVAGTSSAAVNQYDVGLEGFTTSETWSSATTNNEFAALAEALGATAANQMDKAQIDAVTDGSHFTLGDTLDLAIVPYLASAGTAPTSDGLSINYDATALNKGAILGTDYDYDVPAGDVVRITSLATQNLKVRIV
jgi:DNA-binding beta-propeller fold protein YncE